MESIGINQSDTAATNRTNKSIEAQRLFEQILTCDPGPSIRDLVKLLRVDELPRRTVFTAIINHSDFNIDNPGIDLFSPRYILDSWGILPLDRINGKLSVEILEVLTQDHRFDYIRLELCRHLLELKQGLLQILRHAPTLKQEVWNALIQEDFHDEAIAFAVEFFEGEDRKQKVLWVLQNKPHLADRFVDFHDSDIANKAATIILDSTPPAGLEALLRIVSATEQQRVRAEFSIRAADRLLLQTEQLTDKQLTSIIIAKSCSDEQKRYASDILLSRNPSDTFPLQAIIHHVPCRAAIAQEALERIYRATAEENAKRPLKDQLLDQLLEL